MARATGKAKPKPSMIAKRRAVARRTGDAEYQQRRTQLMDAAARIFREVGFQAASINDIAKAVGIDRASLYYYTSGKDELFQEIVRGAALNNVRMAEAIRDGAETPGKKLEKFIVSLMMAYEKHYPYLYAYVQEDMAQIARTKTPWAREMAGLSNRFNAAVVSIIEAGLEQGAFRRDVGSANLLALGIIGMCNWSHRWFRPSGKETAESIGRTFARMVLDGLRA
jgi:AcrR family transcriptional regulator